MLNCQQIQQHAYPRIPSQHPRNAAAFPLSDPSDSWIYRGHVAVTALPLRLDGRGLGGSRQPEVTTGQHSILRLVPITNSRTHSSLAIPRLGV
jgi:hypothetical protein